MPTAPERMRALLAKPGFIPMPAVWDGLTAQLAAALAATAANPYQAAAAPGLHKPTAPLCLTPTPTPPPQARTCNPAPHITGR